MWAAFCCLFVLPRDVGDVFVFVADPVFVEGVGCDGGTDFHLACAGRAPKDGELCAFFCVLRVDEAKGDYRIVGVGLDAAGRDADLFFAGEHLVCAVLVLLLKRA